ncbi:MAG: hypothetical protein HDR74_06735 [Bacteroides sp.]|nr:hypothetical protein [Bacteroides sp.]
MKAKEFYNTVVEMRKFQRQYARSNGRDSKARQYARQYEQIIDHEIKRVELVTKEQLAPRLDI